MQAVLVCWLDSDHHSYQHQDTATNGACLSPLHVRVLRMWSDVIASGQIIRSRWVSTEPWDHTRPEVRYWNRQNRKKKRGSRFFRKNIHKINADRRRDASILKVQLCIFHGTWCRTKQNRILVARKCLTFWGYFYVDYRRRYLRKCSVDSKIKMSTCITWNPQITSSHFIRSRHLRVKSTNVY